MKSAFQLFLPFILCALAVSCSSANLASNSKYKRVEIAQKDYVRPAFFYTDFKRDVAASRGPASVDPVEKDSKEVYFLGLWQQKIQMEKLLSISPKAGACPAFHHTLLQSESKLKASARSHTLKKDWKGVVSKEQLVSNPVLALPVDEDRDVYSLYKSEYRSEEDLDQEVVQEAFSKFYGQTRDEVRELCETGASDGYFVYANMVEYYSKNETFMLSQKGLQALLKLAPIANYYVLQSLRADRYSAGPAFFEGQVLRDLNALWFQHYLYQVNRADEHKLSSTSAGGTL